MTNTKFFYLAHRNCWTMLSPLSSARSSPVPSALSSHAFSHILDKCFELPTEVQWETTIIVDYWPRERQEHMLTLGISRQLFWSLWSLSLLRLSPSAPAAPWACEFASEWKLYPPLHTQLTHRHSISFFLWVSWMQSNWMKLTFTEDSG